MEVAASVTGNFDNRDNLYESSLSFKGVPPPLPLTKMSVALLAPPRLQSNRSYRGYR